MRVAAAGGGGGGPRRGHRAVVGHTPHKPHTTSHIAAWSSFVQRQREAAADSPSSNLGLWWAGPLQMPSPGGAQLQTIADAGADGDAAFQTPEPGGAGDAGSWSDSDAEDEEDWPSEQPDPHGALTTTAIQDLPC